MTDYEIDQTVDRLYKIPATKERVYERPGKKMTEEEIAEMVSSVDQLLVCNEYNHTPFSIRTFERFLKTK